MQTRAEDLAIRRIKNLLVLLLRGRVGRKSTKLVEAIMIEFRLNQRVCRVEWKGGEPFVKVRRVRRVTKSTYYVEGATKQSTGWFAALDAAIESEYETLFTLGSGLFGGLAPKGWTVKDSVRCVCAVRRLQRRLAKREAKN